MRCGCVLGYVVGTRSAGFHPMDLRMGGTARAITGPVGQQKRAIRRQVAAWPWTEILTDGADYEGVEDDGLLVGHPLLVAAKPIVQNELLVLTALESLDDRRHPQEGECVVEAGEGNERRDR